MPDSIIRVENLVKKFGPLVAVDHISFDVAPGEIFGFLGPNGAGKTTTINILPSAWSSRTPPSTTASPAAFGFIMIMLAMWSFSRQE